MERNLSYTVVDINYREFCQTLENGDIDNYIDQDIYASYCCRKNIIVCDRLVTKLREDCNNRKTIFLNINCDEYCLDREEEENYACHGACAMIVPKRGKGYNLYYMNPHGEVMKQYTYFESMSTRTRSRKIAFGTDIIDCLVIKKIVDYCNGKFDAKIYYDYSNNHNYYGANFQENDTNGVCFIFPNIVYYYFGKYFNETRVLEYNGKKKVVPSFKDMLNGGKFNLAIHSCFMDFNKNYKKLIFKTLDDDHGQEKTITKFIKCLGKSNWHILKNITNTMVTFISQEYFMENSQYW